MHFEIRHQISDLEEEIYCFNVHNDSITYNSFFSSKRKGVNDPFGYDWHKFYANAKQSELNALEKNLEKIFTIGIIRKITDLMNLMIVTILLCTDLLVGFLA